jgi:hypothetical protein
MVRRRRATGELAYYRCYPPRPVPLARLVKVAGQRWRIEEAIQTGKGLAGRDQHQVRRWRSWYRWVTLAILAHAFLVVAALLQRIRSPVTRSATCSSAWPPGRWAIWPTGCAGRCGDAATRPAPVPATTAARRPGTHEDHDLRLED